MPGVFDKLNLQEEREIVVLNAPTSFRPTGCDRRGLVGTAFSAQGIHQPAISIALRLDTALTITSPNNPTDTQANQSPQL